MRRQAGVDRFEIDTVEGWARLGFARPRPIDLASIQQAARDGGYTLTRLTLKTRGKIVERSCTSCPKEVRGLELTGVPRGAGAARTLEVRGKLPPLGTVIDVEAQLEGFEPDSAGPFELVEHPVLEVLRWNVDSAAAPAEGAKD